MKNEPSLRLPIPIETSDFDDMPELGDDERKLGALMVEHQILGPIEHDKVPDHAALKEREPLFIAFYDPELAAVTLSEQIYGLVAQSISGMTLEEIANATRAEGVAPGDPDQQRRWELAMLFVYKVAHELHDEWTLRLMATMPRLFGSEKSAMLGFPASSVWNDDERLVLEFTHGVLHRSTSDELFERARAAWGVKGVIRRTTWIGLYNYYIMLAHLNIADAYEV